MIFKVVVKTPTTFKRLGEMVDFIVEYQHDLKYTQFLAHLEFDNVDHIIPYDCDEYFEVEFLRESVAKKFQKKFS